MKIVHLCVSCFYIDGFAYQENELVAQHVADGHDVVVIASTETYGADRRLTYLKPGEYLGSDGAKVIRLPYRKFFPHALVRKVRAHSGVYEILEREVPDVILFHGLCGWELETVVKYKRSHPSIKLYVDSHEDFNNSARTFLSKYLLHFAFYRLIAMRSISGIDKVLCVSVDTINFVRDFYGLPEGKIEYFPLGGITMDDAEYHAARLAAREKYAVSPGEVIFIQSGKMDRTKKLVESLHAFTVIENPRLRFIIVGHLQEDIDKEVHALIGQDERICFLGWKTPDELRELLCAADFYVQPGTQSATMQMSLCCRCAVILDDAPSHRPFMSDNGWLVGSGLSLAEAFCRAAECVDRLPLMSLNSADVASRLLDYKKLAARLYR